MRLLHQLAALWRGFFRGASVDAELSEELRFHLDRETEANIARGMSPSNARRAAHLAIGSVDAAMETARDARPGSTVRRALQDSRFAVRLLRKSPVFTLTSIAIVVLGIGAPTSIFTVVHGVLLEPLPYREPESLVSIWLTRAGNRNYPAAADALELRRLRKIFLDVAFFRGQNLNLTGDGEPSRLQGASVTPNLFSVLGVSATLGRVFENHEDQPGRQRVVLLSDALWRGHFGADSTVVGRDIRLNGTQYTVVGVMPPEFQYPSSDYQAWVPGVLEPGELTREVTENYRVVARLAPGVTVSQARQSAQALAEHLAATYRTNAGMAVDSMLEDVVRDVRPTLMLLIGAVSCLLLLASVNLSNLFAVRARARRAEFAMRLALGASRSQLVAQAIAEVAPVLVIGGVLGVALAEWTVRAFVANAPAELPRVESIVLSAPVLAFSVALLIFAGLAATIGLALQAVRSDFTTVMKDGGRSSTWGRGFATARRAGVAAQIAFALPLLVGASLLVRSAINVMRVDVGFRSEQIGTLKFEVQRSRYPSDPEVVDYYTRLLEAVHAVPGIRNVGLVNRIPLSGDQTNPVHFEAATAATEELTNVDTRTVSPDYFATLGIRLLAGRWLTDHDDMNSPAVALIDQRLARTIWPGGIAIGKRFRDPPWRGGHWTTIVGVVAHVHATGLEVDPLPQVYWSYRQWPQDRMVLVFQGASSPAPLVPAVLKAIRSVEPEQSAYDVRAMTEIVDRSLVRRRVTTLLTIGFAGLALLLAAVGIYGVVAYDVTQRLRELGIRVALGATRRDIMRLVLWQGTSTAVVGSAFGLVLALVTAGIVRTLVFGIAPRDMATLAGSAMILMLVAAAASYFPARRAAAIDPNMTLRSD